MSLYRENGWVENPVSGAPWRTRDLGLALFFVFAVVGLFALGGAIDEQPPAEVVSLAQAERERLVQALKIRDAYAAGQAEAMAALASSPQGLQLAQACMAMRAAGKR